MKLKLRIFALMAMLLCFAFQANAQDQGEITTETGLGNALSYGGEYHLGNDVTTTEAITTSGVTSVIDLNGYTLTIGAGDNKFCDASNITIKNGTISITGLTVGGNAVFCLDEYEETLVTTLTLERVNLVGENYSSAYCIFYIGRSSVLNVKGGEWSLENDKSTSGGVFKAEDSAATLNIDGLNLTAHNVRRVVLYAATTIEYSTLAISGDADGVDAEMEHGFNRSPLAISNSTITMTDMVGRGITAENGAVTIENSTVTMTNCQEATIDVRGGQTVTIDNASTVELDKEPTIASGTISGDVVLPVYVAQIGETKYTTLAEAVSAAGEMSGDVTVEVYDKVTLNTAFSGSYSSINFVGKDTDAEIYLDVQGYITATGKKVSFKDLTLSKSQGGHITNAGFMNVAFGVYDVVEVVYTNCVFANGAYASSGNVTYTGCTFKKSWDKYGLWAYGDVDVTVDACVFDNYRGIKMYAEGKAKTTELTVKNTDFRALGGDGSKPAIVLTYGESVVLENNIYSTSTGTLELDLDGDPNGTAVTSDVAPVCVNDNVACGVLVDGKIYATVAQAAEVATEGSNVTLLYSTTDAVEFAEGVNLTLANGVTADNVTVIVAGLKGEGTAASPFLINNVDDLVWFQKKVDELAADGSTQFAGKYFKLTADINLADINWNPIGSMSGDHGSFKGVFDGDDHTISNLNVEQAGNGIGLFARTTGNAVIKNLKLNNVTVKSTNNSSYVGGVVGNAYASTKIENVHLSGNIYISGRGYIGGIAGHGYVVMDNVSVVATGDGQGNDKGLVTSTFWCAGGILGYGGEGTTNIMNANVENVVVTSAAGGLGAIVGMAEDNNGTQPISGSNLSASNVEIKTYTGAYGDNYANYALGYLYGGNPTSKLTGEIKVENVGITTSNGVAPSVNDAVASIDGTIYFSLASAVVAADGKTITLLRDVELTETLTIPADKTVALDLNGKTVSMVYAENATANHTMIDNYGNLTIDSSVEGGKVSYTYTGASLGTSYAANTITTSPGSVLTVKGGTIENLTFDGGIIAYAIDGRTNGGQGDVTVNVEGGTITSKRQAIRIFANSTTNTGALNISGGDITGRVIVQNANANANKAALNINGGTFNKNDYKSDVLYVGGGNSATIDIDATVSGGTFNGEITDTNVTGFISGGTYSNDVNEYCADGFICEANGDGTYGVVNDPGYVAEWTFDDSNSKDYTNNTVLTVGTLTFKRTFIAGIWNPLYLPFSVSLKDLADNYEVAYYNTMHSYDNDNNGTFETFEMEVLKLTANELNDVMLRANYPYFIRPKNADACTLQIVETDATLFAAAEKVITTTSVSHTFQLKSTHKALDAAALTGCYAISTDGDWALTAGLKPHRLYLTISANDDSPYATTAAKTIRIVARGDEGFEGTTGVDIVETDNAADGTIYDLSGRPVEEPVKGGMYIINGKKVVY